MKAFLVGFGANYVTFSGSCGSLSPGDPDQGGPLLPSLGAPSLGCVCRARLPRAHCARASYELMGRLVRRKGMRQAIPRSALDNYLVDPATRIDPKHLFEMGKTGNCSVETGGLEAIYFPSEKRVYSIFMMFALVMHALFSSRRRSRSRPPSHGGWKTCSSQGTPRQHMTTCHGLHRC